MRTKKQKKQLLKSIIKAGFNEDDIIDAADIALDKYTINQLIGRPENGKTKVAKESSEEGQEEKRKAKVKATKTKTQKAKEAKAKGSKRSNRKKV